MPRSKNEKEKPVVAPLEDDEEADVVKKDGPIEIPEADDKGVDPDLLEGEDALAEDLDVDDEELEALDEDEVDPFGDKWEQ